MHPDDLPLYQQTYAEGFDRRETFGMQYRLRRHDGAYRTVTDEGIPRYGPNGTFRGYIGASLDKSAKVSHNGHSTDGTDVRGYTADMFSLSNTNVASGRALTETDIEHATHNVVIGGDIVDNVMGSADPLGQEIRVDGVPYTVVGVGERQGKTFGQSQDNWASVPRCSISRA